MFRFSLRAMLIAVFVSAFYLSAFGCLLRGIQADELRLAIVMSVAAAFGTALGAIIGAIIARHRAGPVLLKLDYAPPGWIELAWACALPILVLILIAVFGATPHWSKLARAVMMYSLIVGALLGTVSLVVRKPVKLCEYGVNCLRFLSWQRLRRLRWRLDANGRLSIGRSWCPIVAFVPPERRREVEELLREKLGEATLTAAPHN